MRPSSSLLGVALLCLSVRLLSALTSGLTVFNPDEYWQSLEVAYARVWNGGFIPWEFQAHARIRGWTHPALFGVLYWLLHVLRLDTTWSIAVAPRLLQALFAAGGDMALFLLARRLFGRRAATWTLFLSLCSWFYFFCLTRTLSNSLECSLTSVALMLWPDTVGLRYPPGTETTEQLLQYRRRRQAALLIAAFTFVIRPTSALVWLFLGAFHVLCSLPTMASRARCLLGEVLPIGLATLVLSVGFDAVMYERGAVVASLLQSVSDWRAVVAHFFAAGLPLVSVNFVRLNSGTELSALYGTHPFHWYFTEGLATNLGIVTPFFAYALWRFFVPSKTASASQQADAAVSPAAQSRRSMTLLLALQFWTLLIFSFNAHKEPRFILPVVPAVSFLLVGQWMASLQQHDERPQQQDKERLVAQESSASGSSIVAPERDASSNTELRKRHHGAASGPAPVVAASAAASSSDAAAPSSSSSFVHSPLARIVFVILLVNALMAGYFCTTHQSGPARVFDVLQREVDAWQSICRSGDGDGIANLVPSCSTPLSVHFLMNCHSMPLYSHLHVRPLSEQPGDRALNLHFLDCSPLSVFALSPPPGSKAWPRALVLITALWTLSSLCLCVFLSLQFHRRQVARQRLQPLQCLGAVRAGPSLVRHLLLRAGEVVGCRCCSQLSSSHSAVLAGREQSVALEPRWRCRLRVALVWLERLRLLPLPTPRSRRTTTESHQQRVPWRRGARAPRIRC
jgi:hypothetical protein